MTHNGQQHQLEIKKPQRTRQSISIVSEYLTFKKEFHAKGKRQLVRGINSKAKPNAELLSAFLYPQELCLRSTPQIQ